MESQLPLKSENQIEHNEPKKETEEINLHKVQEDNPISFIPLENIDNLKDFNEKNYQNRKYRKYNSTNIENAKKFYKYRFLQKKIKEAQNRNSSTITKNNEVLITFKEKENEKFLKYEKLNLTYEKTEEKNIQKYSTLFLILLEKSIFYFNISEFKKSYNILYDCGIIESPFEFGEILSVIPGYDKVLIDYYIFKNNEENFEEILKGFLSPIDMSNFQNFLDFIKYIFSKINIPSDNGHKTLLINQISHFYYEDNKNMQNFQNEFRSEENNIAILLNAIVNTLSNLKDNCFKIDKDVFNMMVDFISQEEMSKIYDKLKTIKLKLEYDPIKEFYDRFLFLLGFKKEEGNKNNKIDEIKDIKSIEEKQIKIFEKINYYKYLQEKELNEEEKININYFRIIHMIISFNQRDQQVLTTPTILYRINGANALVSKEYMILDNFSKIVFEKKIDSSSKFKHYFLMDDIIDIYMGTSLGENFKKYLKAYPQEEENQNNYMSIVLNKEQIDLKSDSIISCLNWFKAIKNCIYHLRKKNKNYSFKTEEKKIKDDIELIWKNYILKKWDIYGNYYLFKCLHQSNYINEMVFEGRPQTSTIKIDIFEEKKLSFVKVTNNFLKEAKDKLSRKDDRILEYNEFLVLCQLGVPDFFREKLWPILIGNKCGITVNLYNTLKEQITKINNFDELELKYNENVKINFTENYTINKIIKDIIKTKYLFLNEIAEKTINTKVLMSNVYSICICFYLHRFDISYNKNIISIIYMLLLKKISEENAFINLYNLICSNNYISKLYLCEKINITNLEIFFEEAMAEHLPILQQHFKKFGISCPLYLYDWIESFFSEVLYQNITSVIFELYLIYGDYILIQTSLTILKLLEGYLINLTIDDIFILLKMPIEINNVNFFDTFKNYGSIKEKFSNNNISSVFAIQSAILLEPE